MIKLLKKIFGTEKEITDNNRYTEWELIERQIPAIVKKDGKKVIRNADVYQRYDKLLKEYEIRTEYHKSNFILDNL